MGEIADVLRRADRLDSSRTTQYQREESGGDRRQSSRPPAYDPTLETRPRAEETLFARQAHPLLGCESGEWRAARICLTDPQGHSAQQYRRLAIRLRNLANSRQARSIVITSAQAGDGKTTTACNLAIALAMTDHRSRTILVDLDLHRASVSAALGIEPDRPVDAVLRGELKLEQAVLETDLEGLSILATNRHVKDPERLLADPRLAAMIAQLESRFDLVIIDTPPVLATSDAQMILQHAATGLLVVRAGVSAIGAVKRAIDHLPKNKLLASFLNSSKMGSQQRDYYDDYHNDDSDGVEREVSVETEESDALHVEQN